MFFQNFHKREVYLFTVRINCITSALVLNTDGAKRTAPISLVPSWLWARKAQWNPPRRKKPSLLSMPAASSEDIPSMLKGTIGTLFLPYSSE